MPARSRSPCLPALSVLARSLSGNIFCCTKPCVLVRLGVGLTERTSCDRIAIHINFMQMPSASLPYHPHLSASNPLISLAAELSLLPAHPSSRISPNKFLSKPQTSTLGMFCTFNLCAADLQHRFDTTRSNMYGHRNSTRCKNMSQQCGRAATTRRNRSVSRMTRASPFWNVPASYRTRGSFRFFFPAFLVSRHSFPHCE